ncbi:hypothetical protein [Pseudonocardia acaciae]|uniref:hypothetical protein n=1 Tax=Pseudonocardia acaciae TaxID=551276 RepID=UPI0004916876|nr:hypothetical protein [Pseudonocardia acaciae]
MGERPRPDEAARALDEIDRRADQVITRSLIPWWYWWAVAVLTVGLVAAVESREPLVIGVGTGVFVLGVPAATCAVVFGARRHAQPRGDLLGPGGALAIVGFVALVLAVTLPAAFALQAAGVRYPATLATALGGVVMVVGGPVLRRLLRQIMWTHRAGTQR